MNIVFIRHVVYVIQSLEVSNTSYNTTSPLVVVGIWKHER